LKEGRRTSEWRWPCAEDSAYEAALVVRLLQLADEAALAEVARTTPHRPVGVITFYQRQRQRIQDSLLGLPPSLHALVEVATVDSVQGREFPLVLLSCVRSNARGMVGFLNKLPQRINVAMSRAQRQLIILGDASTLASATPGTGSPWLRDVHELLAAQQRVLPSAILGR
jgi:DNA polymerase alpha-associated DNA helicase A